MQVQFNLNTQKLYALTMFASLLISGCRPAPTPCPVEPTNNWRACYDFITLRVNSEYVNITRNSDTAYYTKEDKSKLILPTGNGILIDSNLHIPFLIDSLERAVLYQHIQEIIANPPKLQGRNTDYAGDHLTLQIKFEQDYQKVHFGSLSSWLIVSTSAPRLDSLTFQRGRTSELKGVIW